MFRTWAAAVPSIPISLFLGQLVSVGPCCRPRRLRLEGGTNLLAVTLVDPLPLQFVPRPARIPGLGWRPFFEESQTLSSCFTFQKTYPRSWPPAPASRASLCAKTPFGVVSMSIPTSREGRKRFPHFSNSPMVDENLGLTLPQSLTRPRSCILNFPPLPSSTNSNSPT